MKTGESKIPFHYKTIRITQSRINKGLLAIPVSLINYFPKDKRKVYVIFGRQEKANAKNFTPYNSSSRECRIGGMRDFYEKFQVKDGEELVIQIIDENKYRILTEDQFRASILKAEKDFDMVDDEGKADIILKKISLISNSNFEDTIYSEFFRLSQGIIEMRKYDKSKTIRKKESIPASIRKILAEVYKGKCQISGFSFLMKNGKPYFELHHIKPNLGNHLKNILVVSPNVHAQFTYARVVEFFDEQEWLRKVRFNDDEFLVKHIIDDLPRKFEKEVHYL